MPTPSPNSRNPGLQRVRTLTHLLDNAIPIPGTSYRVGLDPLLGLFPGAGDVFGAVLSAYIVVEAARLGLPKEKLTRMVTNLMMDSLLGSLPVAGDFFDATWKANSRNLAMLEDHVADPRTSHSVDRRFLFLLIVGLLLFVIGIAAVVALLATWLFRVLTGQG